MKRTLVMMLLLLIFANAAARAGTDGALNGRVADHEGRALADATVTATSPADSRTTRTDARGNFAITGLIPGVYNVVVSRPGFAPSIKDNVLITADRETTLRFALARLIVITLRDYRVGYEYDIPGQTADIYPVLTSERTPEKVFPQYWPLAFFVPGMTSQPGIRVLK